MADRRNWTHKERMAAFYVYATEPFGRLRQQNPLIIKIANQIGRTPSALAMKACNFASLDPVQIERGISGLKHASKGDREFWELFVKDSETIASEATEVVTSIVMAKEKSEGPQYVGEMEAWRNVKVRRAQAFFRKAVLTSYEGRCALSGIAVPELLNASHIIPWQAGTSHRADPRNGIALNALYDRAFDRGLFTLEDDLSVRLSRELPEGTPLMGIAGRKLDVAVRWRPLPEFLDYHRKNVFRG